jgi:hypothetical protein
MILVGVCYHVVRKYNTLNSFLIQFVVSEFLPESQFSAQEIKAI